MAAIYNFISTRILGAPIPSKGQLQNSDSQQSVFHLFSSLPPELRRKIWRFALPPRLVEASLDFKGDTWSCSYTPPKAGGQLPRRLPELFSVNVESRELCLEEYVPFANTYIHPTLDLLYILWYLQIPGFAQGRTNFYPIQNQPLNRLHRVAITLARNDKAEGRFGAFMKCLRDLGQPQNLLLCLVGPNLPSDINTIGFSISNGNSVALLDWPGKIEQDVAEDEMGEAGTPIGMWSDIMTSLKEQNDETPSFKIPSLRKRIYYMYSGL